MKWLVLGMLAIAPLSLQQQCLTGDDTKPADPNARLSLYKGQQVFSLNMLKEVNRLRPTENTFFSPFSIYTALMLAYFVSANHTEQSLKSVLNLPPAQDKLSTMHAYGLEKFFQVMRSFNGSSSYQLSTANRLYVSNGEPIRDCMKTLFKDELVNIDFAANPQAAVDTINSWVAQQTRNHIPKLLTAGSLTKATRLVLTNAAYFKGVWKSKFLVENTKKDKFYLSIAQQTNAVYMKQKATFNHLVSEKLGAHILELPYKGEDISIFFLLPPFVNPQGVTMILDRLTPEAFQEMVTQDSMIPRPVEVTIPKFTLDQEMEDLTQILETLGVGDLFRGTADLSSLTGQKGLFLDEAIHKAKIRLDEEGTTAAAATAFFNFRSSRPLDPARFDANHPFIYFIFDKVSQTVLFCGVYNRPTES